MVSLVAGPDKGYTIGMQEPNPLAQPFFKVLVTGDRTWDDYDMIERELRRLKVAHGPQVMVIHGGAAGADSLAGRAAHRLGLSCHVYHAHWERYGRAAGPKRNQVMIDANPDIDLVLVVHDNLALSRGTADCWRRAEKAGLKIQRIRHIGRDC